MAARDDELLIVTSFTDYTRARRDKQHRTPCPPCLPRQKSRDDRAADSRVEKCEKNVNLFHFRRFA